MKSFLDEMAEWVRAQLDDDERAADAIENATYMHGVESDAEAEILHFADTGRIRREIKAKRERLAFIARLTDYTRSDQDSGTTITLDGVRDLTAYRLLQIEVLPYAGRPGYREEWRRPA